MKKFLEELLECLVLVVRFIVWGADLDDGTGSDDWRKASPSLTKVGGIACVYIGLRVVLIKLDSTIALNIIILGGMSALFGRFMYKTFILNNKSNSTLTEIHKTEKIDVNITKKIIEERHIEDGSAPTSLPPVGAEVE